MEFLRHSQISRLLFAGWLVFASLALGVVQLGRLDKLGPLINFGLPAEGIALSLGADRLLDMARTVLNVAADVVTACIVDEQMNKPAKA